MKALMEIMLSHQVRLLSVPCVAQVQRPVITTTQVYPVYPQAFTTLRPMPSSTLRLAYNLTKMSISTMQCSAVEFS